MKINLEINFEIILRIRKSPIFLKNWIGGVGWKVLVSGIERAKPP